MSVLTDRLPTEHEEQRELVRWFRQTWPGVRIFAIPNGGARSPATAGRLKAEGVSSGVPDLFIPAWGLWVEMKRTKGGSLSAEQKDWISYLESRESIDLASWSSRQPFWTKTNSTDDQQEN